MNNNYGLFFEPFSSVSDESTSFSNAQMLKSFSLNHFVTIFESRGELKNRHKSTLEVPGILFMFYGAYAHSEISKTALVYLSGPKIYSAKFW
jgi:hypothetical protein